MYDWARPGVRVVCVNDTPTNPNWAGTTTPTKGAEYTLRSVEELDGELLCTLFEIVNPLVPVFGRMEEPAFRLWRFRPVVRRPAEQSTKIEEIA